jgi:dihydropyrimidinase
VTAVEILPIGVEIGVKDGKIRCIGQDLEAGLKTKIINADGAYVTPG